MSRRETRIRAAQWALAALAWPAVAAAASAAEQFYLGSWTIVSADPAPWAATYQEDARAEPAAKLAGSHVVFGPHSVEGPAGIACIRATYAMDGFTAPQLFQGRLAHIPLPDGTPAEEAGPDGHDYSPQKLAERYGFKGYSWKALAVGCRTDTYFYFPDRKTAVFQIEDLLLVLKRD
jgi:hypothetical protein